MIDPELTDLGVRLLPPSELPIATVASAVIVGRIRHRRMVAEFGVGRRVDHRVQLITLIGGEVKNVRQLGRDQVRPLGDLLLEAAARIEIERAYEGRTS